MTRFLLRLIALLVPHAARPGWREEWLAETGEIARGRGRVAGLRAVSGAIPDAVAMRRIASESGRGRRPRPFRGLGEDVKFVVRSLVKSPAFALSVAGSLSLGIAAMIVPFTFLNALLFRPFPGVHEQHRVVKLTLTRTCGRPDCLVYSSTLEDYRAWREGMTTLTGLAAQASDSIAVTIDRRAYSLRAAMVSDNYFESLGVRPALGRAFIPGEDDIDADNTVVIADTLWRREFGASPNVLGRSVGLGASGAARIVGVAPVGFVGISRGDVGFLGPGIELWIPLSLRRRVLPPERPPQGRMPEDERYFTDSGRLREGKTQADVQSQATLVAARIQAMRPQERAGAAATLSPVEWFSGMRMAFIGSVLSVPLLVLAIGCLNATNMLLARGTQRAREMAVRLALGATRWRIVRPLLVESVFLALIATLAALPIVWWAISVIESSVVLPMPIDWRVAAFAGGMALMSAVASSIGPSLRLSATRPGAALGSSRARRAREALADGIRRAVSAIDSRVPPIELRTLAEISGERQFPERLVAQSVSLLGVIGLLLATAGIYGVMSYFVSFRSREIGVRLALGADPASVLRMTLGEAMRLAVWGAIIGGGAALVTSKIVQSGMYGVEGLDLPYLAGSFLLLAAAMLLASAVPAYRASRVDPIMVLRQE